MKEEKKSNQPKFNIYWIYGAIIFVLLGLSLFGGNDWQTIGKTNISNFEKILIFKKKFVEFQVFNKICLCSIF